MSQNKIALLVAYQEPPGHDTNDAKGMRADAQNYKNFLQTPYGGNWKDSEIILRLAPSKRDLLEVINNSIVGKDYAVIGFFGHGHYSEKNDDIMLQINHKEEIPSLSLRNKAPKSLIVLDCCRATLETMDNINEGIKHFASNRKTLDTQKCQQFYDACIKNADKGNTILCSCSLYEKAYGNATGGIYTKSLLRTAKEWENRCAMISTDNHPRSLSVVQAHNIASKETENKQMEQHPDIEKSRSGIYLPFAVAIYKENN